jgi:L-alanine-DL-glutamate epimerase-like enolase superfamily enzyme
MLLARYLSHCESPPNYQSASVQMTDVDPIERVVALRASFPLATPLRLGGGEIRVREFLLVRITTRSGIEGKAFALSRGLPSDVFISETLAPVLVGSDPAPILELVAACAATVSAPSRPGLVTRAISLVEIALWDIKAQRAGAPLWRLLGGYRAQIPALLVAGYLTDDTTPEELGERLGSLGHAGYRLLKIARAQTPELTRRLVEKARLALPTSSGIVVDVLWAWHTSTAAQRELRDWGRDLDLAWLEDPFPPADWKSCRDLRERSGLRIGVGDEVTDPYVLRNLIELGAIDVARTDATSLGGIDAWREVSAYARLQGLEVSPHAYPEVHVHCACAWPGSCAVELFEPHSPYWPTGLFVSGGPVVRDGMVHAPEAPGLGFELDWECIERHRVGPAA